MDIEIRVATDSDLPALFALDAECFPEGNNDLQPAAAGEIETGVLEQSTFVATEAGQVVGMMQIDKSSSNQWELLTLAITESHRGQGLGSRLMGVLVAELGKSPYLVTVSCVTAPTNLAMQNLLESFGFIQMELLSNHFGVGKHRLRFQLN
jgi:ribosomal protein S18 acetylase RimI-like enzyme